MTPKQAARLAEFDKKVSDMAADPLKRVIEIADALSVHEQTIFRSLRRIGIIRKLGRPTKKGN